MEKFDASRFEVSLSHLEVISKIQSSRLAQIAADEAARAGKWESWAQPGFEERTRSIAVEAQIEFDRQEALRENPPSEQ
jgi:hypothetical protein